MQDPSSRQAGPTCTRRRIVDAAIRSYREIGYRKTAVADIARGASMSPANVYRFFRSRRAIEERVVAELLAEVSAAAEAAARTDGPAVQRLCATFGAISQLHEHRLANDTRLHELVDVAASANWPISRSCADRIRGIVRSIVAAGQASGELRPGSPLALTCCLLDAMDSYLNPSRIGAKTVRPTFNEMMNFCAGALRNALASADYRLTASSPPRKPREKSRPVRA